MDVHSWDTLPNAKQKWASFHTGVCRRCHRDLDLVKDDPVLDGVATFSAANNLDFLAGMDDERASDANALPKGLDPLLGQDEHRLRKEYVYLFENATVVEAVLVALNHMQVSACYFRSARQRSSGVTLFHKNIISFYQ